MTTREIVLDGGSPWGFRMHGGADVGQPLRISRVNPGSKAAQKGIREGDVISSINGQPTRGISNSDAHALLRNAGQTLHLGLNEECGGSPKRRAHRSSQQQQQQQEVTKHSSQQSTSRFSGSVNGVTDQNYNTVTSRGKVDASTEGVSSSETKGKRRQKQSAATQHSLAPPLQEESPGSSAVSSDVKEEPAASPSKSKKRKRNRKKNRAQQKNAAATTQNGKASQTSATSTDVLDLVQQSSSKDVEKVDKPKSLEPSIEDNISQSSTVIETHLVQQTSCKNVEKVDKPKSLEASIDDNISQSSTVIETHLVQQTSSRNVEVDTSQLVETSKKVMLGDISQSSAVLETNTVQQKVSHIKNINNSRVMEHSKGVTEKLPTSLETKLVQQKSSKDVQELNVSKSSPSISLDSSKDIKEETTFSTLSNIDVVQQTDTLIVTVNAEDSPESELNSTNHAETNMTSQQVNDMVNDIEHSGTEKDKSCNERIDTNEQKTKKSNGRNHDNCLTEEETILTKAQDNASTVSTVKVSAANTELDAEITSNSTAVIMNVHNTVSSEEETNVQVEQANCVQEGEENSEDSQKLHLEATMLSNSKNQVQTTAEISRESQRVLETAVQVKSCQSSVECRAVVVETVDEEVWEEAVEFSVEGIHDPGAESCPLTSNTVSLQQYDLTPEDEDLLDPRPLIAADEEETLRNFLYSLNLADYGRDSPRRGKRRSSHEVACNPVHHQRGLEVIMEENSSEISDSGDSKRGRGWKDAIYIPSTNEIVYLNEDSADEGEYTTEEASSKTGNAMRSLYYAETTTTLTTEGTSSAEMREFIYRTVGETAKDDEDVFSAHMEKMLEADAENGPQIIELASEEEEDKEDVVTTQKTEEQQSGVEVVFVEDDTTSTSSGAPANWEDVEDAPYEDVMFPIQGQPKYTHRREDSIYENMDVNYGRDAELEDDTVYENVDFTKRDAQVHVSFSTSSSEPRVSSRHLTSLVPPEQDNSVAESSKRVQLENDNGLTTCNSEATVSSRHHTSLVPPEQGTSVGESPKQVQQESGKEQATCNSEATVSSRHHTSLVPPEQGTSVAESPKQVQQESGKEEATCNSESTVSIRHLNGKTAESVGELLEQVHLLDDAHSPRPAKRNPEPELFGQNINCLVIQTSESVGESLEERHDVHHASSLEHKVSNLSENCLVPATVSEQETEQTTTGLQEEFEASSCRTHHVISGRDICDNMGEESNKEPEGQDAVDDGRDSITPTNNLSRRGSSSSDDTASQGTAFYCPVDAHSPALSSDADISSLTEEVPDARRKKVHPISRNVTNPLSLKELCVATVVCMPYGTYILNILGVRPHPTPVRESPQHIPVPCDEQWLATPTSDDPNLLVYLSPSQRKVYNEEIPSPDEMQSLLDLHCKFLQRRGYHEKPPPLPPSRKYRPLTSPRGDTKISPASRSSSRLLAILREASEQEKVKAPPLPPPPDMSSCCKSTPPAERLKVRSLSDWLQLVRCTGGEANENTNGARDKDSTPPILSTQSSPGVVRRSAHLSGNHLVRCAGGEKPNGARSKDSTPPILSTQSSPGTVRRSASGQSENQLGWYVGCSANEYANGPTSPILSTQSSPGAPRRSQRSLPGPEEEHLPQVPVRGQENHLRRSLHEPEEERIPPVPVRDQENRRFDADNYHISKRGDIAIINSSRPQQEDRSLRPRSLPPPSEALVTGGEIFRQQMYLEYMHKVAERTERRRQRVIRLSSVPREDDMTTTESAGGPLESEFMDKVRERMDKLGIRYDDEDGRPNGVGELPKHLQEFLTLTSDSAEDVTGVWSPSTQKSSSEQDQTVQQKEKVGGEGADDAPPVVWTPKSAGASPTTERKEFRPIKFESPTLSRKNRSGTSTPAPKTSDGSCSEVESVSTATTTAGTTTTTFSSTFQPWQTRDDSTLISSEQRVISSSSSSTTTDRRLVQSQSAPASGLSSLAAGTASTKLPRAQNPTITLLQKAREGQLPKGALYLDHRMNSKEGENAYISPNEIMYSVKKEYDSEGQNTQRKKIVELTPRKFEGIGPTTDEGVPIVLRSEIKDANQAKWYKRMYDSLHRAGKDDDYITIRYKTRKGQYPYTSPGGYLSEPEPACYDSDIGFSAKYATLDRRRIKNKENDFTTSTLPRSRYVPHPSSIKYATQVYKNQPGRIEDYEPGRSSISEKETKQWWDEVLDIFDGWLESYSPHHPTYRSSSQLTTKADATTMYQQRASAEQQTNQSTPSNKTFMAHALKDGYESDSTLVFKRRDENLQSQLSPAEQKQAYKTIQKGGEVPLHGLRKPAPERPKESPHRYVESEVTIHYRSPVRSEAKEALSEEELARRQAEAMRRIYQEERRRKYLQELQDMHSRRHTDNFTPSQKSPIPLNRYDDFFDDVGNKSKSRDRTPEPKLVARALYNFVGQTSRELSFRRGDIIFVRRQIDKNWYEGEHNAMVGLFPFNYVEIIPYDGIRTMPKRPTEGQARAKFNFIAQTHLELSLVKGELVVLTRRVDDNWFEGRIGNRKGIFPVSYVEVLQEPGEKPVTSTAPPSKPASHTTLVNGTGIKQSMGSHSYQPSFYYSHNKTSSPYTSTNPYATLPRQSHLSKQSLAPVNQTLHIDTHSEPVPYRALYNYRPQNEDELELCEGDTVYVMEKCDDGWYVGSSQRTGYFGTFPGNYVERI